MNSLQLTIACYQRGLLSKEATAETLRVREQIIKQAIRKEAASIFSTMGRTLNPANAEGAVGKFVRGVGSSLGKGHLTGGRGKGTTTPGRWPDVVSDITKLTALAGLTAGAGTGIHAMVLHSRDKRLRERVAQSYDQMFTEHPDLERLREANPDRVRRAFGVLAQYAPSLAANPVVAASFVAQQHRTDHIGPDVAGQLAETQATIDRHHEMRSPAKGKWEGGMSLATQSIGSGSGS